MKKLAFGLKQLQDRNRDGSFQTQRDRAYILSLSANTLDALGYRNLSPQGLKQKHIAALVERWHEEGISQGTFKNRMSALRWWAEKINKPGVVAKSNDTYAIPQRQYVTNREKSREVEGSLSAIKDANVKLSLELQAAFGLRRQESIKFNADYADQGDHLKLKASWTKGGREREVPITTPAQRELLDRVRQHAGKGSLIPSNKTYIQQLRVYERNVKEAGLNKMHGLRHAYALDRYRELTGFDAPVRSNRGKQDLSPAEREIDKQARQAISRELGHERLEIVAVYVGAWR